MNCFLSKLKLFQYQNILHNFKCSGADSCIIDTFLETVCYWFFLKLQITNYFFFLKVFRFIWLKIIETFKMGFRKFFLHQKLFTKKKSIEFLFPHLFVRKLNFFQLLMFHGNDCLLSWFSSKYFLQIITFFDWWINWWW